MPAPSPAHAQSHRRGPALAVAAVLGAALAAGAGLAWGGTGDPQTAAEEAGSPSPATTTPAPTATSAAPTASAGPEPSPTPSATLDPDVTFTLVAAGDLLPHGPVLRSAQRAGDGDYDFSPLMENVRPFVAGADLALCHLEVPIVPEGVQPTGYPVFGSPASLAADIREEGWNGCTVASNHSMDRGFAGVVATLDAMDEQRLGHAGTARSEQEAAATQMYSVRAGDRVVSVASISHTYGLNGLPKPEGKPWAVDTFDADSANVAPILEAAQAARDEGADVVVASVHCCVEYRIAPNDVQRSIVEQIGDSGLVDLYIGHHAHVPQPIERVPGGPDGDGMWAAFGHGNYLSNQGTQCCVADTNSGYLTTSTITVDPDGAVDVSMEWTAVTVDRLDGHTMHVLREILDSGAGTITAADARARWERVAAAVGDAAPERVQPPSALADAAYRDLRWWQPGS